MVNGVTFVAPDAIRHRDAAERLGVKIIGRRRGHLWEQHDLPRFLRAAGSPPLLSLANTAPLRYANSYLTIHDLAFIHHPEWNTRLFAAWYRYLVPRIARRAQHVFTVSGTVKGELVQCLGLRPDKISVTPNGIAASLAAAERGSARKKQILAVGTFSPRKNHDRLIRAFLGSGLAGTYTLVIAGSPEDVFRQCPPAADNPAIRIIERPDDAALAGLYRDSEILVSLSAYEGFGLPVLEGLYFGCKVLCSNIPVYHELFDEYVYFCDPAKTEDISLALMCMAQERPGKAAPPPRLFEQYSYGAAAKVICGAIFG